MPASLSWTGLVSVSMRRALGRPPVGGVEQDGLLDAGELGEELADRQAEAGPAGPAAHEVGDLEGQDAGEDVDPDVVLGPVVHRARTRRRAGP